MVKHIILDTDIGGDPDDAFALLLALNSPELSLDLVVTNDEHKGHRASFTEQWLRMMGKDIPVVSGIDLGRDKYCLIEGLLENPNAKVDFSFLDRIAETVEGNEETHYVCIGPQSNLARFIEVHPELKKKSKLLLWVEVLRIIDLAIKGPSIISGKMLKQLENYFILIGGKNM